MHSNNFYAVEAFLIKVISRICKEAFYEALQNITIEQSTVPISAHHRSIKIRYFDQESEMHFAPDMRDRFTAEEDIVKRFQNLLNIAKHDPSILFKGFELDANEDNNFDSKYGDPRYTPCMVQELKKPYHLKSDLGIVLQMLDEVSQEYNLRYSFKEGEQTSSLGFIDSVEGCSTLKLSNGIRFRFDPHTKKLVTINNDASILVGPFEKPIREHEHFLDPMPCDMKEMVPL